MAKVTILHSTHKNNGFCSSDPGNRRKRRVSLRQNHHVPKTPFSPPRNKGKFRMLQRGGVVWGGVSPHQNRQNRQDRQHGRVASPVFLGPMSAAIAAGKKPPNPPKPSKPPKPSNATHPLDHTPPPFVAAFRQMSPLSCFQVAFLPLLGRPPESPFVTFRCFRSFGPCETFAPHNCKESKACHPEAPSSRAEGHNRAPRTKQTANSLVTTAAKLVTRRGRPQLVGIFWSKISSFHQFYS